MTNFSIALILQVYKVWITKDTVPDQELLDEIISDLDDSEESFEGNLTS